MGNEQLVDLLLESAILKWMPRTGWAMRGVVQVESVAEHSYGVGVVALVLADALQTRGGLAGELDMEKVLIMALLHDLAEVRLTDLPVSAIRLIPGQVKSQAQISALAELLAPLGAADRFKALLQEFEDHTSPEARLVRDADKLEMMIQCLRYEQAGSQGLEDYWQAMDQRRWYYSLCADLYARLKAMRPAKQIMA